MTPLDALNRLAELKKKAGKSSALPAPCIATFPVMRIRIPRPGGGGLREFGRERAGNAESPPVALGEPAVEYPPALFMQGISGSVELRLFVDSAGQVVPESTTSSGPADMRPSTPRPSPRRPSCRYAPGRRDGRPVAMTFLQPIHFRHPATTDSTP